MKKIRCFDIEWETDGADVDLPSEVIVEVANDVDLNDDCGEIANALSDKTGWLVLNVNAEEVK